MASENSDIINSIRDIFSTSYQSKPIIVYGEVIDIVDDGNKIDIININSENGDIIRNVNLGIGNNIDNYKIPTLESRVLCYFNQTDSQYYVFKVDETYETNITIETNANVNLTGDNSIATIVSPTVTISSSTVTINNETNDTQITFNGGDNEGLVKVIELTDKLNALEERMNALYQSFFTWIPVIGDGGTALKTNFTAQWGGLTPITETIKTEIQNQNIKH